MQDNLLYLFVLMAALAHASWNAIIKNTGDRLLMLASIRAVGLVAGIIIASILPIPASDSVPFIIAAALFHYLYYFLIIHTYRIGGLSQVYPISRGVATLLVTLLATLIIKEALPLSSMFATLVIATGIVTIGLSTSKPDQKVSRLSMLMGISIAAYSLLSGIGIRKSGSILSYIAWLEIITGIGMVGIAYARRKGQVAVFIQQQWQTSLGAGLLSVSSYAIALWAMSALPIAPVVALRESSIVFATVIGTLLLKEGYAKSRIIGSVIVMIGIVILSFNKV
ncbi:EamA family transporter [Methylobacillus pratensis]